MFNTSKTLKVFGAEFAARGVSIEMLAKLQGFGDKDWIDQCAAVMLARLSNQADSEPITPVENNHAWARAIMGTNFLGLKEVEKAFGVKYTANQRQQLAVIPFSESTLRACKDTHELVVGFAMTINDIRRKVANNAAKLFCSAVGEGWYNSEPFVDKAKVGVRWYLLRKKPVDKSISKTYNEHLRLIPQDEENPWARDVVFATMLLYLTTGERLFDNGYVRCRDVSFHGWRVSVGDFYRGLYIYYHWDDYRHYNLGVCSVRNSD